MPTEDALTVLERYAEAKRLREGRENQWRMNAAYCLPVEYGRWAQSASSGNAMAQTVDADFRARFAFDNTGVRAIPKYKAICKRLINPEGVRYHSITANNRDLMRNPRVRTWFSDLTDLLFSLRHSPQARFNTAQLEMYGSIGVYGNGPKTTLWRNPDGRGDLGGFAYKTWPMYSIFWIVDDTGRITDVFRRMWLTKRKFQLWKPDAPLPQSLNNVTAGSENTTEVEFVHVVSYRNKDYDPKALDARRHPWKSCYLCVPDQVYVGEDEGFQNNPYQISATETIAGDAYGYSPAEIAFPALGGINAIKKTYLKQAHKAVDPTLLVNDDGVLSGRIDARPGKFILGGVDAQGRQLVQPLNTGANFQVVKELLQDDRTDVNDSFLVTLFQILTDTPEMTAAEVYERVAEKAALFAPTMAALQELDQEPQVQREITLLVENGRMPPLPPELIEAKGEYKIEYVNPMAKAMYAGEVSGFMRWLEMGVQYAANTGDPSPLDNINMDEAYPEIGYKMDVRPNWIASADQVKAKRDVRAQQAQQRQMIEAAPAAASAMATMQKSGANGGR